MRVKDRNFLLVEIMSLNAILHFILEIMVSLLSVPENDHFLSFWLNNMFWGDYMVCLIEITSDNLNSRNGEKKKSFLAVEIDCEEE